MVCLACAALSPDRLCRQCRSELEEVPVRRLPSGLLVWSAFHHSGAARILVARLKYHALPAAAGPLAEAMAALLPADAIALAPIPRSFGRRWRYGIDAAALLATKVGSLTGLPVTFDLASAWWTPQSAGRRRKERTPPTFRLKEAIHPATVLVDDVVTTGGTLEAAARACGVTRAVTATAGGWRTTL